MRESCLVCFHATNNKINCNQCIDKYVCKTCIKNVISERKNTLCFICGSGNIEMPRELNIEINMERIEEEEISPILNIEPQDNENQQPIPSDNRNRYRRNIIRNIPYLHEMRSIEIFNTQPQDIICSIFTILFILFFITSLVYFIIIGVWFVIDNKNFKLFYAELFIIILLFVFCFYMTYVASQNNRNRIRRSNNNQPRRRV